MKRMPRILVLALALLMLCAACSAPKQTPAAESSAPEANFLKEPLASGGKKAENLNAKELVITHYADSSATAQLNFVLGSQISGVDEATAADVPPYKAYLLDSPCRLIVEFDSLAFYDYTRALEIDEDDPLFYGVFRQLESNSDIFRLVFQLRQNVNAELTSEESSLTIRFTPEQTSKESRYYVVADAAEAFRNGEITYESGFSPVLCADLNNIALISVPFETEAEAQEFKASVAGLIDSADMQIAALSGNDLPIFVGNEDFAAVYEKKVVQKDGQQLTLPVVMPDGLFLCSNGDGSQSIFSKHLGTEDGMDTETLWIMDANGRFKSLLDIEFATLSSAAFSPDGKKLAILERTADSSYLFIYDMETRALTNLGDEALGSNTSAFIWDALGTAIYAVSGEDTQKMYKYDFTIPDETARLTLVEDREVTEGDLGFYNSELYYANITEEDQEMIYRIKPEGGMRKEFATGGSFALSQDNTYMAILVSGNYSGDSEEDYNTTTLKLKEMETGKEQTLLEGQYVVSMSWSADGKLYYTVSTDTTMEAEYGFDLCRYDPATGEHQTLASLMNSDFRTTADASLLYIPLISDDESGAIRATYALAVE